MRLESAEEAADRMHFVAPSYVCLALSSVFLAFSANSSPRNRRFGGTGSGGFPAVPGRRSLGTPAVAKEANE